jgi:hypothetical protein
LHRFADLASEAGARSVTIANELQCAIGGMTGCGMMLPWRLSVDQRGWMADRARWCASPVRWQSSGS